MRIQYECTQIRFKGHDRYIIFVLVLIIIISGYVSDVKGYNKTFLIQISFSIEFLIFDKKSLLTKSIRFSFRLLMELKTVTDVVKIFQIF